MEQRMKDFQSPPGICRGTDLWMLNDRLDPRELDRQIGEMKDKGFYSFIARTYVGLKSDYPGEGWKQNVHAIVASAKKHDMRVYLQAGYMPGSVWGLPEEYALNVIKVFEAGAADEPGQPIKTHAGKDYVLCRAGVFLDMFNVEACQYYVRQSYEEMWQGFEDEYGQTIVSVWVDEPHYGRKYLPWTRGLEALFTARWGYSLAENVHLLYLDEGNYQTVRYHYRTLMIELFEQAYFLQVRNWCNEKGLWFSGHLMDEDSLESQITSTMACMPFYKYFDIPGIDLLFADLPWRSGSIPDSRPSPNYRSALYNTPLQCTSAAHQAGKTQILAEIYGCISQNLNFRDQKHMFDEFAALGINHKMAHAIFYSMRGRAKRAYPPQINYQQPYWGQYRHVTDYCARASCFISQGQPVKEVLVMHPLGSAAMEYRGKQEGLAQSEALRKRDRAFTRLLVDLLADQCAFELGDEESLATMGDVTPDGRLRFGHMTYRTVVLPEMKVIKRSTLALLKRFHDAGGTVHILGELPTFVDGWPSEEARETLQSLRTVRSARPVQLLRALRSYRTFALTGDGVEEIVVNHRRAPEGDCFFFYNRCLTRAFRGTLNLPGTLGAQCWRGEDGTIVSHPARQQDGHTQVPVVVAEGGSLMLSLEKGLPDAAPAAAPTRQLDLAGAWQVRRKDQPNALVLEFARYQKGDGAPSALYPIMAIHDRLIKEDYRGKLSLAFTFEADVALKGLSLALENPDRYAITLNGQAVPVPAKRGFYLDHAFECVPLPDAALRVGSNALVLHLDYIPLEQPNADAAFSLFRDFKGMELECAYLLGDFAVEAVRLPAKANTVRVDREFVLTREAHVAGTELTDAGYPFYAGIFVLEKAFDIAEDVDLAGAKIQLEGFRGVVARVLINGQEAGETCWFPYALCAEGLVKHGRNVLTVELTGSLRNLLGPYHRPTGEHGRCFTGYNHPNLPWIGAVDEDTGVDNPDWAEQREVDTGGWTEAYMLVSQGLDGAKLLLP